MNPDESPRPAKPEPHDPQGTDLARQVARAARGGPAQPPKRRRRASSEPGDPQLLGEVLKEVISDRGWEREVNLQQLLAKWPDLVGAVNAAHSRPTGFADQVLSVQAESTTWASSLRMIAPALVARLNEQLGQGTVTRVVVSGPQAPSWKKGRRSVPGPGPRDTYG